MALLLRNMMSLGWLIPMRDAYGNQGLDFNGAVNEARFRWASAILLGCVKYYGKTLNATRSYYLTLCVFDRIKHEDDALDFLKTGTLAAMKEYRSVWIAAPRIDKRTDWSRYRPEGLGGHPSRDGGFSFYPHLGTVRYEAFSWSWAADSSSGASSAGSLAAIILTKQHLKFLNNTLGNLDSIDILRWDKITFANLYQTTAFGDSDLVALDGWR
ncbi:hypothetical protein IFR05_001501 [Cadophora sp. M221]|nr:hypothetical protein IFR05_001501 [Cadophora sp. M221]